MEKYRRLIPPVNTRCRIIDEEWNKIHPARKSYLFKGIEVRKNETLVIVREEHGFAGSGKHDILVPIDMVFYYE